jgi:acylphosphatase
MTVLDSFLNVTIKIMDTIQKSLMLSGRVQGVGFRYFTVQNAEKLKIKGWVRNRRDGKVEALLQGSPDNVEEMIARMKHGPSAARVDDVDISEAPADEEFKGFEVRR